MRSQAAERLLSEAGRGQSPPSFIPLSDAETHVEKDGSQPSAPPLQSGRRFDKASPDPRPGAPEHTKPSPSQSHRLHQCQQAARAQNANATSHQMAQTADLQSPQSWGNCNMHAADPCDGQSCQDWAAQYAAEVDSCCIVCMEAQLHVIFQPCGHNITCRQCAAKVLAQSCECPMCRRRLQGLLLQPR